MNNNSSLKEFYVKIQQLYSNAVNMLTAINQSFNSNSSEITINYVDTDDVTQTVRIPSFLYLENKIEQIDNNLSNLMNMPKSGEAWFSKASNMYKLQLVQSNCSPITPKFDTTNIFAQYKDTTLLKDMVNPKTYLKIDLTNVPDNIEKIFMRKIVLFSEDLYENVSSANLQSYEEYSAYLYNLVKGKDYEEYDSELDMPTKRDEYKSAFSILEIPTEDLAEKNPYIGSNGNLIWKIKLDTLTYTDQEDSSIEYLLHQGQYLTLDDNYTIYRILSTNTFNDTDETKSHEVILEEVLGHTQLQTTEENSSMVLHLYNGSYDKWHYVEIPLEENQYVVIFLGTIWNNVRSTLSSPILINLGEITMHDKDGNPILKNGKEISYIDYYNEYCKNIGDLLLGISNVSYSQLSNFTTDELEDLQDGSAVQTYVSQTISNDILKVQRINTHLIDDESSNDLVTLHSKKNELNAKLTAIDSNIDDTYSQLISTDESSNLNIQNIKSQLDSYYTERIKLQKEIISVVDNINVLKTNVYGTADAKYRIRGNASISSIEEYLKSNYVNCDIIGLQYEYKYKSITKDTTNVSNINSSIFTEWNRVTNNDKDRRLSFDETNNTYTIQYENYDTTQNVTKWNQIDIPITQGEDVVLRVRYKYSIGQPFINLYTPWSDELTIEFPIEYNDTLELNSIIEQNDDDTIKASFDKTLINDGYEEHISNKIVNNNQIFFHMPENIYSGFNTPENNLISLKDKLQSMSNELEGYKDLFTNESLSQYKIYLEWEGNSIELTANTTNNITINDTSNIQLINKENFIKKNMNIVIKNVGDVPLKLYSIFPGNTSKALFQCAQNFDADLSKYESVPLLYGEDPLISNCLYVQRLGQWAYFREDNPYTQNSTYYEDGNDDKYLNYFSKISSKNINDDDYYNYFIEQNVNCIASDKQMKLPKRIRANGIVNSLTTSKLIMSNTLEAVYNIQYNKIKDTVISYDSSLSYLTPYNLKNYMERIMINKSDIENIKKNIFSEANLLEYNQNLTSINNTNSDKIYSNISIKEFNYPITNDDIHTNKLLLKYENINVLYNNQYVSLSSSNKDITLSSLTDTNSNQTLSVLNLQSNKTSENDVYLTGGFFIPQLLSDKELLCNNDQYYKQLNSGESVSIPLIFEYYLNEKKYSVTKTLHLDLKTRLSSDILHYDIVMNAIYDYQASTTSSN